MVGLSPVMRSPLVLALCAAATLVAGAPARVQADSMHVVESGETLSKIGKRSGCTVKQLQRANDLSGTTIYEGQTLVVPDCKDDDGGGADSGGKKSKKVAADYGLDGADGGKRGKANLKVAAKKGQSIGAPWSGSLQNAMRLPAGKGYYIRREHRAFGTTHAVKHIIKAIQAVRKRFPRVHKLAIGDLSEKRGGEVSLHRSHQSGRDVDIGFYFKKRPKGYPENFVGFEDAELDLPAMWALLHAFARTADSPNGVQAIYLDYALQKKIYNWAKDHDVPTKLLDSYFEYPDGTGLVRHEDNHHDHFHIRFKCPEKDTKCTN